MNNKDINDKDSLLSLIKNNGSKIIDIKNNAHDVYVGSGESYQLLRDGAAENSVAIENILIRKKDNDLIVTHVEENNKEIRLNGFFDGDDESSRLEIVHPHLDGFAIDGDSRAIQSLEDGSSLIYIYGEPQLLSGLIETYAIKNYYQLQINASDSNGSTHDDSGSDWMVTALILGASTALIGGAAYWYWQHNQDKNKDKEQGKEPESNTVPEVNDESILENADLVVKGTVTLGPAVDGNGLSVTFYSVDGRLVAEKILDSDGGYQASLPDGMAMVKAVVVDKDDGPDYRDESTGTMKDVDSPLLSIIAIGDASKPVVMHVNPLTTLSARLLLKEDAEGNVKPLTVESIQAANRQIANVFLGEDVDIARYEMTPLIDKKGDIIEGNAGGNVLAMISALEEKGGLTTDQVLDQLSEGFTQQGNHFVVEDSVTQLLQEGADYLGDKLGDEVKNALKQQLVQIKKVVADQSYVEATDPEVTHEPPAFQDKSIAIANNAPVAGNQTVALTEDQSYTFAVADFGFSDSDQGDSLQSVTIIRLPAAGAFELNGEAVVVGQMIQAADILNLIFTPTANASGAGYADFQFTVFDGELSSAPYMMTIDVMAITDEPAITVTEKIINDDGSISLSLDVALTDLDGSEYLTAALMGIPAGFRLTDGVNSTVTDGSDVDVSHWNLSSLTFIPLSDYDDAFFLTVYVEAIEQSTDTMSTIAYPVEIVLNYVAPPNEAPVFNGSIQSLALDGSVEQYAAINPFNDFPTTAMTLEMWLKPGYANDEETPFDFYDSRDEDEVLMWLYPHDGGLELSFSDDYYGIHLPALFDGGWHHVAFSWDSAAGDIKIYLDGQLEESDTLEQDYISHDVDDDGDGHLVLGQESDGEGGVFDGESYSGEMRDVRIWNVVRTADEIEDDMGSKIPVEKAEGLGLVSYYPLIGDTRDWGAAQNHLSLNEGTWVGLPLLTSGSEYRVNDTTTSGNQNTPSVAVLPDEGYRVVWVSDESKIQMQRFDEHGHTIGAVWNVYTGTDSDNRVNSPLIVAHADGGYAVGWNDGRPGLNHAMVALYDAYDQPVGSVISLFGEYTPNIAALKNGGYAVGTASSETLHLDVYNAAGSKLVDNRIGSLEAWDWSDPDLVALDDGGFAMVWRNGSGDEPLRLEFFDSDGTSRGSEIGFGVWDNNPGVVQLAGGDLITVYEKAGDLIAQRFTQNGVMVGDFISVNPSTYSNTQNLHNKADIISLDSGGFFVSWTTDAQIGKALYGRYFDSIGRPLTNEILLNTMTQGERYHPALAQLPDGQIEMVWTSNQGNDEDIYSKTLQLGYVISEEAQMGAVVGQVKASDPDQNDSLTYTLLDNTASLFAINPGTGVITLVGNLDYETAKVHTVKVQIADAQGLTAESVITLYVAGDEGAYAKDAPRATNNIVSINEDQAYNFTPEDFGFIGEGADDTLHSVTITRLPEEGALALNGATVSVNQVIQAADILSFNFTPAANEADDWGYADFQFTVSDGKLSSAPRTMDIDVIPIADAPVITVRGKNSNEDGSISLDLDVTLTDLDGSEELTTVLTGIPAGFRLTDGVNSRTTDGSNVDVSQWNLSTLTLTPLSDYDDAFTVTISATATEYWTNEESTVSHPVDVTVSYVTKKAPVFNGAIESLSLDGSTDQYAVINPVNDFPTTAMTLEMWLKPGDNAAETPLTYSVGGVNEVLVFMLPNSGDVEFYISNVFYTVNIPALFEGDWHHLAYSWDSASGALKTYLDGDLLDTGTLQQGVSIDGTGGLVLGQEADSQMGNYDPNQAFSGEMRDVRIWNVVRTADEIEADRGSKVPVEKAEGLGLVSFYPLTGHTQDLGPAQNHLDFNGGTWKGVPLLTSGSEYKVNDTAATGNQDSPSVAILPDGGYRVVWVSDTDKIQSQRLDEQGHEVGSVWTIYTHTTPDSSLKNPFIATQEDGSYVVGWNHFKSGSWNKAMITLFDANDQSVGSSGLTLHGQYNPNVAVLKNGGYAIGTASGTVLHLYIYDIAGNMLVNNKSVDSLTTWNWSSPDLSALDDGGFAIVWRNGSGDEPLRLEFFDSDGTSRGSEISFGFEGDKPKIAQLTGGDLIAVYERDGDLIAQRFTQDGVMVDNLVSVKASNSGNARNEADIIALDNGGFFVSWTTDGQEGKAIYGRYFDSTGRPLTNEILLNTMTPGEQYHSALAQLPDGQIEIVWTSNQDNDEDIYSKTLQLGYVISEDAQIGTVVGQVKASDPDQNDSLAYSLLEDTGDLFEINPGTGVITLIGNLDYETAESHILKVQVADDQGLTIESLITISVADDQYQYGATSVADDQSGATSVADDQSGATSVADDQYGATFSGPAYQMVLQQGNDSLSLLESVQADGQLYYTLDKNQDDRIDDADRVEIAELSEFMTNANSVHFADKVLTLPTQDALINAGLIDDSDAASSVDANFWAWQPESSLQSYSPVSSLPVNEDQTDALVVFQVIG